MRRLSRVVTLTMQFVAIGYLTLVASLLFWSHAPRLIGWTPRVVLTGSMQPVIRPGDVAVIASTDAVSQSLPSGRVVLVEDSSMASGFYLHRVVRHDPQGRVITRGDANRVADTVPVEPERVKGQLRLVVPMVGLPVVWIQDRRPAPVVTTLVVTWMAMMMGLRAGPRPRVSETRRGPVSAPADYVPGSPTSPVAQEPWCRT